MTVERIRQACSEQPFRPFTLHLADGLEVEVPHRDFMAVGPGGRTILVYRPDESYHVVDLLLVTDLHISPLSKSNGAGA
jgi:hypothetical protein